MAHGSCSLLAKAFQNDRFAAVGVGVLKGIIVTAGRR
jgi:hypothetical protein